MSTNELGFDDDFMAAMLGDFLDESDGYLSNLSDNLLVLEDLVNSAVEGEAPQAEFELLNEMFRDAHSLKGLSAMLQLGDINSLTHKIENLFDAARAESLPITRDLVEVVLRGVDCLTNMVEVLKDPNLPEVEYEAIVAEIQELLENDGVASSQAAPAQQGQAAEESSPATETPSLAQDDTADTPVAESSEVQQSNQAEVSEAEEPVEPVVSESEPAVDPLAEITNESDIPEKYLAIFIDECEESLDSLSEALLAEEETEIDPVLAMCHRIKGGAASIGLNRTAKMAHLMEDVLQELRDSTGQLTSEAADALMNSLDSLRAFNDSLRNGTSDEDTYAAAYQKLCTAVRAPGSTADPVSAEIETADTSAEPAAPPVSEAKSLGLTEAERTELTADFPNGGQGFIGCVDFDTEVPLIELKARLVCERLESVGTLFDCRPEQQRLEDTPGIERLVFGLVTEAAGDCIKADINLEGVTSIELVAVSGAEIKSEENNAVEQQEEAQPPVAKQEEVEAVEQQEPVAVVEDTPSQVAQAEAVETMPIAVAAAEAPAAAPKQQDKPGPKAAEPEPAQPKAEKPAEAKREKLVAQRPAAQKPAAQKTEATPPQTNKPTETLRVDIERLDHLMNLAGQLVINKARFGQVGEQLKSLASHKQSGQRLNEVGGALQRILVEAEEVVDNSSSGQSWLQGIQSTVTQINHDLELVRNDIDQLSQARTIVNDLSEAVHQLERVSDGIQKSVMDTRMVPIGPLFGRFKRVIRDITRNNGKDIQLAIRGDKTELDKRMIDELGDPLIHMVRNAADHGIESPEERTKAGKQGQGTVTLDAFHRGNKIFVQVKDDGKGLDPEKLKNKAIEKGIITAQDAERLSKQQALQLIWEPGFSTAEKVTDISGRGMGMDIVRSKIEQLHGAVELDSELGKGTTITINLPLTMAILPSLLTVISDDVFAVPMESVSEIVSVSESELSTVHGLETARVRGRVISIVELSSLLKWNTPRSTGENQTGDRTLVVIGTEGDELGLAVDGLLGEEDIVIKSLAENYHEVPGLAGASILGDGRVSLILDVPVLIDMASNANSQLATSARNQDKSATV